MLEPRYLPPDYRRDKVTIALRFDVRMQLNIYKIKSKLKMDEPFVFLSTWRPTHLSVTSDEKYEQDPRVVFTILITNEGNAAWPSLCYGRLSRWFCIIIIIGPLAWHSPTKHNCTNAVTPHLPATLARLCF